jgi:hypothetical protein
MSHISIFNLTPTFEYQRRSIRSIHASERRMESMIELNESVKNSIAEMFKKELSRKGLKLDPARSDIPKNRMVFVQELIPNQDSKALVVLQISEETLTVDSTSIPHKDCRKLTEDLELLLGPPIKSTEKPPESGLHILNSQKKKLDA